MIESKTLYDGKFRWLPQLSDSWSPAAWPTIWCPPISEALIGVWDEDWREEGAVSPFCFLVTHVLAMYDFLANNLDEPRRKYEATYRVYRLHEWSPSAHFVCNAEMKRTTRMTLLLHKRPECGMHALPKDVVRMIIKCAITDLAIKEDAQRRADVAERVRKCTAERPPKE